MDAVGIRMEHYLWEYGHFPVFCGGNCQLLVYVYDVPSTRYIQKYSILLEVITSFRGRFPQDPSQVLQTKTPSSYFSIDFQFGYCIQFGPSWLKVIYIYISVAVGSDLF
jgi:hypothetical protein